MGVKWLSQRNWGSSCAVTGKFYSSCVSKGKWTAWWGRQDIASLPEQWGHSLPEPLPHPVVSANTETWVPMTFSFSSVTQSCLTLCDCMVCSTPGFPAHHQLAEIAQTHIRWVSEAIQPSHPLSSPSSPAFQSFPASLSFPMSQFFSSGDQSIGALPSASVLPMNIQHWFPLWWIGWISLQSKGLSRVFSNTAAQKHQFFSAQLSLWSNSYIHIWLLEKPELWPYRPFLTK